MRKGTIPKLIILLLILSVILVCSMVCLYNKMYLFSIVLAIGAVVNVFAIVNLFSEITKKATFMFNAIENNDYSFKFSENVRSRNELVYNRSLNRIKDIMQQVRKDMAESEKYYETILSHSSSAIIVIDPTNGIIHKTNSAAEDILGITNLTHIRQLTVISAEFPTILTTIKPSESRIISFYNETSKVTLSLSTSYVKLNNAQLKIVAMSDIGSELYNEQTESWTRLSRVLTHEIMNSLAPITSLSEHLRTNTDPETLHKGLEIIGDTGKSLMNFVDNYRRLTRIPTPDISTFNLSELLEKQIALLDKSINTTEVDSSIMLSADENLISQVLTNLIKNALEATQEFGEVWIKAQMNTKNRIIIEVCNSGTPIPEEIRDNIFVPFFTTKGTGSGIGLSLSRQIMRQHGGTLTHLNHNETTIFCLQFPT